MATKVWQEFHCHRCPDGGRYIMVRLNVALNRRVEIVCPFCGSQHERTIEGGVIYDRGKSGAVAEQICPPKSACSTKPRARAMLGGRSRDGVVIKTAEDMVARDAELVREAFLTDRWDELYGGKGGHS